MEKVKLYIKVWSAFTKLIRAHCFKDRIIDSVYFGTYYKQGDSYHFINTSLDDLIIEIPTY